MGDFRIPSKVAFSIAHVVEVWNPLAGRYQTLLHQTGDACFFLSTYAFVDLKIVFCVLCVFFSLKPLIGTVQMDPMVQSTLVLYILFILIHDFCTFSNQPLTQRFLCTCGLSFSSHLTSRWAKILEQPNGSLPASCQGALAFCCSTKHRRSR